MVRLPDIDLSENVIHKNQYKIIQSERPTTPLPSEPDLAFPFKLGIPHPGRTAYLQALVPILTEMTHGKR